MECPPASVADVDLVVMADPDICTEYVCMYMYSICHECAAMYGVLVLYIVLVYCTPVHVSCDLQPGSLEWWWDVERALLRSGPTEALATPHC
jgi:hypothetical protein